MVITAGTLCSGIGSPELAMERCGIQTLWASEIDPQAASVHARHFQRTYQLGDIRNVGKHNAAPVDVICGGSPCQNFSQAGDRTGLAGKESKLFHEYIRVIQELRPTFAVWENVPGVLTSNRGRDFAAILRAFRQCGAIDIAWRTLDAQFAGVPQRRRRVFLVADFRSDRSGAVLFEPEGAYGNSPSRKEPGSDVAYALTGSNQRLDASNNETFVGITVYNARNNGTSDRLAGTLQARASRLENAMPLLAGTLRANGSGLQYASTNIPGDYLVPGNPEVTADIDPNTGKIIYRPIMPEKAGTLRSAMGRNFGIGGGKDQGLLIPQVSGTLAGSGAGSARPAGQANELDFLIPEAYRVRRLMPVECERLMGFPDGWTQWGADNAEMADTPRYRMLGNSIAVPVMEWIARRMVEVM